MFPCCTVTNAIMHISNWNTNHVQTIFLIGKIISYLRSDKYWLNSPVWLETRYIVAFSSICRVRLSGWEVQGYRWNEKLFWKLWLHQNKVTLYYLLTQRFAITLLFLNHSEWLRRQLCRSCISNPLQIETDNEKFENTSHIFCRNFLDDAELQKVKEVLEYNQEITKHSYGVSSVQNSTARLHMHTIIKWRI